MNMPRIDPHNSTQNWWTVNVPGLSLLHAYFTTHEFRRTPTTLVVSVTEQGGSVVKAAAELF